MNLFFRTKSPYLTFAWILILTIFLTTSCKTKKEDGKTTTIDSKTLQVGPVVHDSLTLEQIEKIQKIYLTFAEVEPSSLEETITNFKRDLNPDNEISIWLSMANAYEKFIQKKGLWVDKDTKVEAYKLILMRSMMSGEEAKSKIDFKLLSSSDVEDILNYYDQEPKPITVGEK